MIGCALVWLRRDLRLDDHAALFEAARASERVACAFVLDPGLLRGPRIGAPIVQLFFQSLGELRAELRALGSDLLLLEGDAAAALVTLARRLDAGALFFNRDADPDAVARDDRVARAARDAGLAVRACDDVGYFAPDEVLRDDGEPYVVYGAYRRRWLARFGDDPRPPYPAVAASRLVARSALVASRTIPAPEDYGHRRDPAYPPGGAAEARRLLRRFFARDAARYAGARNVPALDATSHLSPHLRAGTIGVRTAVAAGAAVPRWLDQLVWRDFYLQILAHHPRVAREPFLAAGSRVAYRDDPDAFAAWREARTGYPIVDAAMTQLARTGWMHNRLRMVAASFLTKHLLVDYRLGERWFEQRLADADLAANNGGWQWCASTGTDPQPYFRVFNPTLQAKTFDPDGAFVRAWIPALSGVPDRYVHEPWRIPVAGYPPPIVDHAAARARALATYGAAFRGGPVKT